MVKVRLNKYAKTNRDLLTNAIKIFGKTLTLRTVTRTVDNFGQLSNITTSDTTFRGDLQFDVDLDQVYIQSGIVEVGEGILYLHPTALSTLPGPQDQIIDGNSVWEIVNQIQTPELDGVVTHYSYRVKRRINESDN